MIDREPHYQRMDGASVLLETLCAEEPGWAASRIRWMREELAKESARVSLLEAELKAETERLRSQVRHTIALHKLIGALAHGQDLPDVRSEAPYFYEQAVKVKAWSIARRPK